MTAAALRVSGLTRVFDVSPPWLERVLERRPKALLTAVDDVSFEVPAGGVFALVGESGSGKSTIAKMIAGLLPPTSGEVARQGDVQMVFQDPFASMNPRWRVGDIIEEPVRAAGRPADGLAARLLEQVGLTAEDALRHPHQFSGGQRQRIAVARALAPEPALIIADEPTSALDVSVQAQVLTLMRDLQARLGVAWLFISHNLAVVEHMADRVGVLYLGRLVEEAPRDELFARPRHPYTRMLLEAAPRIDRFTPAAPPEGEIPDPLDPPAGCAYHPRCPLAVDRCRAERPAVRALGPARVACHLAA